MPWQIISPFYDCFSVAHQLPSARSPEGNFKIYVVSFGYTMWYNKNRVLLQVVGLSAVGIVSADLKLIGGAAKSGVMLISKKISDANECILINQSVTGLYENRIDLLTV